MQDAKNVSIIDHTNNRPFANVANVLPRDDIMFYVETIYDLFNPEKNLNFLGKENMKDLFFNNTLCSVNNINKIKDYKINDCVNYKILNSNNELSINPYANYQLIFPLIKNSTYKLYIKFKDDVTNPRFGLFPYGDFSTPIIEEGIKSLTNHIYEKTFISNFDTSAMFYQEGIGTFEIDYISLVKIS